MATWSLTVKINRILGAEFTSERIEFEFTEFTGESKVSGYVNIGKTSSAMEYLNY